MKIQKETKFKPHAADLTKGSIGKGVATFAVPILLGNLFQLFYSLADTRIVGSALGDRALAAVGATSVLCNLMIGFMNGMAFGFSIPISRNFGAGDLKSVKKAAGNGITLGVLMVLFFSTLSFGFMDGLLGWLNISPELLKDAKSYISIILSGMFVTFAYNMGAGMLRAVGDTVAPLLFLVLSSILNVVMDITFIYKFHMGVAGAAYATVLAQMISAALCWYYILRRYEMFRVKGKDFLLESKCAKELLASGCSMACMHSLVQFGTVLLQTAINTLGQDVIVAHTAARKVSELFMLMFGVLGSTIATFAGQNYGAAEYERIRKGLALILKAGIVWCVMVFVCSQTFSPYLIAAVTGTSNPNVLKTGALYLRVDTCFYIVPASICILRNALQGVGDHVTPIVSSFIELAGKVCFAKIFTPMFAYWGIIWAEPVVWFIMIVPLLVKTVRNQALFVKSR